MKMEVYLDIHIHPGSGTEKSGDGVRRIFSLTTPENVLSGDTLFSAGIHPKDAASLSVSSFSMIWRHPNCIAIGECGLDSRVPDMRHQIEVFRQQIVVSEELSNPVVIHAVRTIPELLRLHQELHPSVPWIIHSFRGNEKTAQKLLDEGFYLSFGSKLVRDISQISSYLCEIPLERLFLETDESKEVTIQELYILLAKTRGISVQELQKTINNNFHKVFRHEL